MTEFADALNAAQGIPGHRLRVNAVLDQMDAKLRAEVEAALHDRKHSSAQLGRALTAIGYDVSEQAVKNWRLRYGV